MNERWENPETEMNAKPKSEEKVIQREIYIPTPWNIDPHNNMTRSAVKSDTLDVRRCWKSLLSAHLVHV